MSAGVVTVANGNGPIAKGNLTMVSMKGLFWAFLILAFAVWTLMIVTSTPAPAQNCETITTCDEWMCWSQTYCE